MQKIITLLPHAGVSEGNFFLVFVILHDNGEGSLKLVAPSNMLNQPKN